VDGDGHEHGGEGAADLEHDAVACGDAEAEAAGNLAEGLRRGETPDAGGHAPARGDSGAQGGVLLGDGAFQRVAEHAERGAGHAEGAPELGVRARGRVQAVPPLGAPLPHPHSAGGPGASASFLAARVLAAASGGR
jgi:hypothetical protein